MSAAYTEVVARFPDLVEQAKNYSELLSRIKASSSLDVQALLETEKSGLQDPPVARNVPRTTKRKSNKGPPVAPQVLYTVRIFLYKIFFYYEYCCFRKKSLV